MSEKIKLFALLFVLLPVTLISGCLTTGRGPQFTRSVTPEVDKAVIYVYRSRGVMTADTNPGIKLNDISVVKTLFELSYFPISVTPGTYTLTPKQFGIFKTTEATINAKAGQVYFVRLAVMIGHLKLEQVDPDEARAYMATCYRINPKLIVDPRVLVDQTTSVTNPPTTKVTAAAPEAVQPEVKPTEAKQTPPPTVNVAQLSVESYPAAARIRILNIKPQFKQGIELKAGRYHVEVTAPGHSKYLEWISLKAGETRTLQISLTPEKLPPVSAQKAAPPITKKAAPVTVATATKERVTVLKAPANASSEERRYAAMFASSSSIDIRNAAKNLYYHYGDSAYMASAAEQCLLQNYNNRTADNIHTDAMAWLCKALANTGEQRFAATLTTVSETANSRKIRRYAEKSLSQLR